MRERSRAHSIVKKWADEFNLHWQKLCSHRSNVKYMTNGWCNWLYVGCSEQLS